MPSRSLASERQTPTQDSAGDRVRDHPVLFGLVGLGYLVAIVGGLVAAWAAPRALGYRLDWTREATGLFAADGVLVHSAFRIAFASFPITIAASVVLLDLLLIRMLVGRARPNRSGLLVWAVGATVGLAVLLAPLTAIVPPYGLVRLLTTPALGLVGLGLIAVTAAIASVVGQTVPVVLYRDGLSVRAAAGRGIATVLDTPKATLGPLQAALGGGVAAMVLLLLGSAVLALAFGIFIVGLLLLPVVLVLWVGAALAVAFAHVRYRLATVASDA